MNSLGFFANSKLALSWDDFNNEYEFPSRRQEASTQTKPKRILIIFFGCCCTRYSTRFLHVRRRWKTITMTGSAELDCSWKTDACLLSDISNSVVSPTAKTKTVIWRVPEGNTVVRLPQDVKAGETLNQECKKIHNHVKGDILTQTRSRSQSR